MSRPTCTRCQGSGEGWHADQRCTRCNGTGLEPDDDEEDREPLPRLKDE
jgi:DnaJ-class molecular chaperone